VVIPNAQLIDAVDRALGGDWQSAHEIVQEEDAPLPNWIHAVVHWMEGDLGNARYWFRRAGRSLEDHATAEKTLRAIRAVLAEKQSGAPV
jgi:hypothetical protein